MNIGDLSRTATPATTIMHDEILCAATPVAAFFLRQNIKSAATGIACNFHHTLVILRAVTVAKFHCDLPQCMMQYYGTIYTVLRSVDTTTLHIPSSRHSTLGDRSLFIAAPRAWNKLPPTLRSVTSLTTFRRELKTLLFRRSFGLN